MTSSERSTFRRVEFPAEDPDARARVLGEVLGLTVRVSANEAIVVTDDGEKVRFQPHAAGGAVVVSFAVDEDQFELILGRVLDRRLPYWADRRQRRPSEINHHNHGRGFYFCDGYGLLVEVATNPGDISLP